MFALHTIPRLGVLIGMAGAFSLLASLHAQPTVRATSAKNEMSDVELANSIRRLFSDRCYTCHGPDQETRVNELRLDRDESIQFKTSSGRSFAVPGDLSGSEIWNRINNPDPEVVMPPPSSKNELSDSQKQLVKEWIQRGAKYRAKHWSFERLPGKIELPKPSIDASRSGTLTNAIDLFISDDLSKHGMTLQPTADRRTLARRACLALTGCLPSYDQVQRLVESSNPDAYSEFVDGLLASPQFGERNASLWLDLARYADTHGYQTDRYRDVWPYRDWVISAINRDLPWDSFLSWQIAGDMIPNPTQEQRLATAFNRLHRQNEEGGSTEEEFRVEYMTDRVNTLGTAVMGLTLQCTRCHDHKYDPLKQKEYYQLCDMFDNIRESGLTSYWTDSMPGPTLLMLNGAQKDQVETLQTAMASVRQAFLDEVKKISSTSVVEDWYSSLPEWPQPLDEWMAADFSFENPKAEPLTSIANRVAADKPGSAEGPIEWKQEGKRSAIVLDGDNALVFPKTGVYSRTQEFSICLELKLPKRFDRAVVLHRSKSWTDAGSRGYELLIEDGHFSFGVIHYWPSSAIRIRCKNPIAVDQWTHVALVYGGTNLAEDTHIYVDGKLAEVEVVQDSLHKDILYERVDVSLSVGARNRDRGLPGGMIDLLQVYDRALTGVEISGLATDRPLVTWAELSTQDRMLWTEHYARRIDRQCQYHQESFLHYFQTLSDTVQNVREMMVMDELKQNRPTRFLNRGAYDAPGEVVQPGVHRSLMSEGESMPTNRLELAQWLTSDHHPLTARVAVNHIWQQMFGRGLVITSEDFGIQGQPPTHPQLLDYLARELIRSGWSRKSIFRSIALSQTFRQSGVADERARSFDPDGALLSHFPPQRLTSEEMRDGVLQVGHLLSERPGGPPAYPYQPSGLWEEKSGLKYPQSQGEGLYRRSLYTIWKRTSPPPAMMLFDSAGREVCSARREVTVTSLQALVMMNDPQFIEASRAIAFRSLGIHSNVDISPARFDEVQLVKGIERAYRELTSLECPETLRERLHQGLLEQIQYFANQPGQAAKLLGVGQWRGMEVQEETIQAKLAALTIVVNAILNSDGFAVMR